MTHKLMLAGSTIAAAALIAAATTPALADSPVAQATASAVTVTVAGTPADSGTYTSSNNGKKETTTGDNRPKIAVLSGQSLISAGTLDQDAKSKVVKGDGKSNACAGLAGDGATVAQVGDGNCLKGGKNLNIDLANIDLSKLKIVDGTVTDGLPPQLTSALGTVTGGLSTLTKALSSALSALDGLGVVADLGAVQGTCKASPGKASGDASLANAAIKLRIPGQPDITLLNLKANPAPNTELTTDPGDLVQLILASVQANVTSNLAGAPSGGVPGVGSIPGIGSLPIPGGLPLGPLPTGGLGGVLGQLTNAQQTEVLTNALNNLGAQLKPLTSQLISLKLNSQSRPSKGAIDVSAFDLRVLAGAEQLGFDPLRVQIGHVTCGPNRTVKATTTTNPTVPTAVNAGYAGQAQDGNGNQALLAGLGGFALVLGAGGTIAYRRRVRV